MYKQYHNILSFLRQQRTKRAVWLKDVKEFLNTETRNCSIGVSKAWFSNHTHPRLFKWSSCVQIILPDQIRTVLLWGCWAIQVTAQEKKTAWAAAASFAMLLWDRDACAGLPVLSRAREGPSPTKPHDTPLATQTSAAWLTSLTNRALVAYKQLQSSTQSLPRQANASCWVQAGLDLPALPSVLPVVVPATLGQPWPSTSCFPESRSREQLDLFSP